MTIRHIFHSLCFLALLYFSFLMVLITIQYIPIDFEAAFLGIKQDEIKLVHYQYAFFTHVYTSIFALLLGITQFIKYVRAKFLSAHRWMGRFYVLIILLFAAPSGLVMGYYANGGFWSQFSFCLLAVLWFYATFLAYLHIKRKNITSHKKWMIRSYALTLSAISLRLFKWVIANTLELPPMDTYQIVAWLGWVVNLVVAELIILRFKR